MKCTRCGKEMTIKPVQSGTDESGEPVFTRYAFCYDCKIKVNLDKQKERDTQKKATAEDVVETKTKRKKKRGKKLPSVSLPKRRGGRGKTKARKERRGGGLLKFLLFLIVVAVLGFAAYTYRHPIAKFAQQMYDKYMNQTEENQPEDSKNEDLNIDSGDDNNTATPQRMNRRIKLSRQIKHKGAMEAVHRKAVMIRHRILRRHLLTGQRQSLHHSVYRITEDGTCNV